MTCFGSQGDYPLPRAAAPQTVESVMNHRLVKGRQILAAVSGGVQVAPGEHVSREALSVDRQGTLGTQHGHAAAPDRNRDRWWWD
jgi:hypothetical protein